MTTLWKSSEIFKAINYFVITKITVVWIYDEKNIILR